MGILNTYTIHWLLNSPFLSDIISSLIDLLVRWIINVIISHELHAEFVQCVLCYSVKVYFILSLLKQFTGSWPTDAITMINQNTAKHYNDVIMGAIASQITSLTIVYSIVYSGADQRKHHSSTSLAFVRGIHRGPVNSPHKWPVTRKMLPFDDVIIIMRYGIHCIQN